MVITVGTWVELVIDMMGLMGAGMELVVGRHAGQSQEMIPHRVMPEHFSCEVKTLMTPDHIAIQVRCSG